MKLGKTALLEIVNIVLDGLANQKDISDGLRQLDLDVLTKDGEPECLILSTEYLANHPRVDTWDKN